MGMVITTVVLLALSLMVWEVYTTLRTASLIKPIVKDAHDGLQRHLTEVEAAKKESIREIKERFDEEEAEFRRRDEKWLYREPSSQAGHQDRGF